MWNHRKNIAYFAYFSTFIPLLHCAQYSKDETSFMIMGARGTKGFPFLPPQPIPKRTTLFKHTHVQVTSHVHIFLPFDE